MAIPHKYTEIHDLASMTLDNSASFQCLPVLTIARIKSVDLASGQLCLECAESPCKNPCTVVADISMVDPVPFIQGTLLKVFGETALTDDKNLLLKAKIIKVVDELDVKRLDQAHKVRSEYLKERTKSSQQAGSH